MLYDSSTAPHLKSWLVRTLEPICDAEPGALADYVLALLKHNVPENEMRKELTVQLEEFLEKEGPTFIDTLFTVLRTKSYLPYTDSSPAQSSYPSSSNQQSSDVGIPIPLDGLLQNTTTPERGQKRSLEYDDHQPSKGPRLGADAQFSRYSNSRDYRAWGDRVDRQGTGNMNGQRIQTYQPPDRRGICRDYHKNGYCARGALCKYSHGDDAFVPSQLFPMTSSGPMPFMPMFPNGGLPFAMAGPGATYDPHEAHLDMRPNGGLMGINGRAHQHSPLVSRRLQEDPSQLPASGELPVVQDLTPQSTTKGLSPQPGPNGIQSTSTAQSQGADMDVEESPAGPSTQDVRGGFGGGRGAAKGKGTFPGDVQSFRPERRNDKTLVVEKIPQDKLSLDAVNGWFKRFGTVTNVAIDVHTSKALVSFSEHREALAAWKSEDAVFNNRFVKVFWHRPLEGHGQKGARMLAASAPLVASISGRQPASTNSTLSTSTPVEVSIPAPAPAPIPKPPASGLTTDLAAKQKLLEQRIAEQKSLMSALVTATAEEKKNIMARLRKLGQELQPLLTPTAATATPSPAPGRAASAASQAPDHEQKEKERLDKELELHHAASAGESTEELQAKLVKLREEAASLGISEYSYAAPGAHRPYRGRGRGGRGSFFRGAARGGPPRGSMKLDNRPRQLLIKSAAEDAIPAIQSWYETTGQLESVQAKDGNVVIGFRTRSAAEQAFAKGNDIPSVGIVQISWHTGSQPNNTSSQALTTTSSQGHGDKVTEELRSSPPPRNAPHSPRNHEEEVASGWGDGDEDGMGF